MSAAYQELCSRAEGEQEVAGGGLMTLTDVLERRLREVSQRALFSEVEHCLKEHKDIVEPSLAERVLTSIRLQEMATVLDYDMIGDPRQESQYAA